MQPGPGAGLWTLEGWRWLEGLGVSWGCEGGVQLLGGGFSDVFFFFFELRWFLLFMVISIVYR